MANVIQRLVQLVLDRKTALKMEADAKRSLGGVNKAVGTLRSSVKLLAVSLAAAFSIRAISRFISSAIETAKEADKIWRDLAGTINATGDAFSDLEPVIRSTAAAFQAATTVGDEDFAAGLTRMIGLTGNVSASLNNMGLVANVAAQYFSGKLEPAIDLVAKVSTGYITQLQRMGIQVKSAQEGLDVLAERSAGAAARQMETLTGQTAAFNNAVGDMKEALGNALFNIDNTGGSVAVLTGAVQDAEHWITENRQAVNDWVTNGWRGLIVIVDAAYRGIRGFAELFVGFFQLAVGIAVGAVAGLVGAFANLSHVILNLSGNVLDLLGFDKAAAGAHNMAKGIDAIAASLKSAAAEYVKSGLGYMGQGGTRLANRTGLAEALLNPSGRATPADPTTARGIAMPGAATGKGGGAAAQKQEVDAVSASIAKYADRLNQINALSQLLGKTYDRNGEQLSAMRAHMNELVATGDSSLTPYLQGLAERMDALRIPVDAAGDAIADFNHQMDTIDIQSAALGDGFDELGAKATALQGVIASLADLGASDLLGPYVDQLDKIKEALALATEQSENYALAVSNLSALIAGAVGGELAEVAKAKAKENLLLAAEQVAHGIVSALNPFTAGKAAGHFAAAAKYGAIAAGWSALGAVAGGGGGGGSGSLSGARGGTGAASERTAPPSPEISIYLTGDMNAMDARVQKWVLGAAQAGRERYGDNAIVRTAPRRG